jgi:hypothetical protein
LIAQDKDVLFMAEADELLAYEEWQSKKELFDGATEELQFVRENKQDVERRYEDAQW